MSDDVRRIEITVPGNWWVFAAAFSELVLPRVYSRFRADWHLAFPELPELPNEGQTHAGFDPDRHYRYTVFLDLSAAHELAMRRANLGDIAFTRADGTTTISASPASPWTVLSRPLSLAPFWSSAVDRLQAFAREAHDLQRDYEPTAEQVIERYYRSQKIGNRKSLRQIAEETGYSYGYLRAVKIEYDKAGKWGSKKKLLDTHDNESGK